MGYNNQKQLTKGLNQVIFVGLIQFPVAQQHLPFQLKFITQVVSGSKNI